MFTFAGTLFSGVFGVCFGTSKYCTGAKLTVRFRALFMNVVVAVCQFFTVLFFLIGWVWSLCWAGILIAQSGW